MLRVALRYLLEICARLVSEASEYNTLMLVTTYKKPPMEPSLSPEADLPLLLDIIH